MSSRTVWLVGALGAVIVAGVLTLFGQWSAGLEVLVVAVVLALIGWRRG